MSEALTKYGPLLLTVFLIIWTIVVSPYSKYGNDWAVYPALAVLPIVVIWHSVLVILEKSKGVFIAYGLVHTAILFVIWVYCLMKISKDSL